MALLEVPTIADLSILADISVVDIFATYETTIVDLINRFLPLHLARVRRSALSPGFDMECRSLCRQVHRLERLTRLAVDNSAWVRFCERYASSLPTFLLSEFVDDLLLFLTILCNQSTPGWNSTTIAEALNARSCPQRSELDSSDPINFRLIANVS